MKVFKELVKVVILILAELMIKKGAVDWNHCLYGACRSGDRDLVELMIGMDVFKKLIKVGIDI